MHSVYYNSLQNTKITVVSKINTHTYSISWSNINSISVQILYVGLVDCISIILYFLTTAKSRNENKKD